MGNKRKQILRTWSVYRRVSDARALPALLSASSRHLCCTVLASFTLVTLTFDCKMESDMEALMAQAGGGRGAEVTIPDKCVLPLRELNTD